MSEQLDTSGSPTPKEDPETFVLRGRPRPVVRFRRGLIVGAAGAVASALIALSWLALEPPGVRKVTSVVQTDQPERTGGADALASLPRDYGDVPRLGPPLPGDLGRPILDQQRSVGEPLPGSLGPGSAEAERARSAAEVERQRSEAAKLAARTSPLMVELARSSDAAPSPPNTGQLVAAAPPQSSPAAAERADQQRKIEFARPASDIDVNPHSLIAPSSPWTLTAGTLIPASLITGLNSDLPGIVIAQVTENVRDSATGRTILIPQGARLIGSYDSMVAYGQRRALLVWTRIVLPDGSSVRLDNMPASDTSGFAGLEDKVDSHGWQLLKGIVLSTLFGVGTQLSLGSGESDLVRAIRESAQQNAAHAGDQITSRNLEIQPTISVRPGWPLCVIVNKDLILQPWSE